MAETCEADNQSVSLLSLLLAPLLFFPILPPGQSEKVDLKAIIQRGHCSG
jgi:hypothetical protein